MSNSIDILDEIKNNFLVSSLDTNIGRAFPDVRDGLKPGQRACLWDMYTNKYMSTKPHVKSAKISGSVIGRFWPHSDVAIYETFARMSQTFTNNVPTVDFHGSNGNIILGGDAFANQRYTEARLSGVAEHGMFCGIDKDNVDMILNFSEDEYWPKVLPAIFPNLLVNGTLGIGVSLANMFLPHSFSETANLILKYIKTGELDNESYYPDFPTGGTIVNKDDLAEINKTGRGKVVLEAGYEIKDNEINFYEMPYQVYIEPVIEKIKEALDAEKIYGIKDVHNKSDKNKISLVIECAKGVSPEVVVEQLFKETDLRKQYNANQNGIVSKTPVLLNLQQMIDAYIEHNCNCIKREHEYDMKKAQERLHIIEGLLVALNELDFVIETIRHSNNPERKLMEKLNLDEEQVKAILSMRLGKLSKLETDKLVEERDEKIEIINMCEKVISSVKKQKEILSDRLNDLKEKYGDKRRTKVVQKEQKKKAKTKSGKKDVAIESVVVDVTNNGYIKSIPLKNYRKTAGSMFSSKTETDDIVMLFTNKGNLYRIAVKNIKKCASSDKGTALGAILKMKPDEKVLFVSLVNNMICCDYVLFATKNGIVKKSTLFNFEGSTQNLNGTIAMKLKADDEVAAIETGFENDYVNLVSKNVAITFESVQLNYQGKVAGGVKGISLSEADEIIACSVGEKLGTPQNRGGKGRKI